MPLPPVALLLLRGITVAGSSTCPSAGEVTQQLAALGVTSRDGTSHQATLDASPDGLELRLADASGTILGRRLLASAASCSELAQAAAVLIGTWEAQLGSAELAAPPVPAVREPTPLPRRLKPKRLWASELGVGVESSYSEAGATFGVRGYWSLTPDDSGLGMDLWLAALGSYNLFFYQLGITDPNESQLSFVWQRFPLGAGAHWRFSGKPAVIDAHAEALLAALRVDAPAGFATPLTVWSVDVGVAAGLRVAEAIGPALFWFDLSASVWPATKTVSIAGNPTSVSLPPFQVLFSLGLGAWRE
jgi:hypothetical protein